MDSINTIVYLSLYAMWKNNMKMHKNKNVLKPCCCYLYIFIFILELIAIESKTDAAEGTGRSTFNIFMTMFRQCVDSPMPNMQFSIDDIKSFVNYPSKTTVGFAPKFTSNRKFFANLVSARDFKDMLEKDALDLWKNMIKKMRYCDEVVMDQELLLDFYDREVDQTKI